MRKQEELTRICLKTEELMSYLVRLYLFQESSSVYVWALATYEVFHSINRVGILNKFLSSEDIYESTFLSNKHVLKPMIDTYMKIQKDGYYKESIREYVFYKEATDMVSNYFAKLAGKLSIDGCISFDDVETYLRKSGFIT